MTIETFKERIKKVDKYKNTVNYLFCVGLIIMGIYIFLDRYNFRLNEEHGSAKQVNFVEILFFPLFLILNGIYGFWQMPKFYVVNCINSSKSIEEKSRIIEDYFSIVKIDYKTTDQDFIEIEYTNKLWGNVGVILSIDQEKVLFRARARSYDLMDFGLTNRATRKLTEYLNANL